MSGNDNGEGCGGCLVLLLLVGCCFWFSPCTEDTQGSYPATDGSTQALPAGGTPARCIPPEQLDSTGRCVCGYGEFRSEQGSCTSVNREIKRSTKRPRAAANALYNRASNWYDSLVEEGQDK